MGVLEIGKDDWQLTEKDGGNSLLRPCRGVLSPELAGREHNLALNLLHNQLANSHPRKQQEAHRGKIGDLQGNCSRKTRMNRWRCKVNENSTSRDSAPTFDPGRQFWFSGEDGKINSLNSLGN